MKQLILTLNATILFACLSIELGAGASLVLFHFPFAGELTVANYHAQFVDQIAAAAGFFTNLTYVVVVTAAVMLIAEWRRGVRWVPICVLVSITIAGLIGVIAIFPINEEMAQGVTSEARLHELLDEWIRLNRARVGVWGVQWSVMMAYFGRAMFKQGPVL